MPIITLPDGGTAEFPDDMPMEAIEKVLQRQFPAKKQGSFYSANIAEPVTSGLSQAGTGLANLIGRMRGDTPEMEAAGQAAGQAASEKYARPIAETLVPQTMTELGAEVATGGTGKLANVFLKGGKLGMRTARMALRGPIAGAAGGYAGAKLEGAESPGIEAAIQGVAGGLGEGVGTVGEFVGRRRLGRAARQAREYQADLGKAVRRIVPEFGTVKTGDDFLDLVTDARSIEGTGKQKLGQMLDDADNAIRAKVKTQKLNVPLTTELTLPGPRTPAGPEGLARGTWNKKFMGELTFDQADARLKSLYRKAYTADAVKDTEAAMKLREEAAGLRRTITDELERIGGRDVASTYDISRQKFDRGLEMMREIRKSMRPSFEGPVVDEAALQTEAFNRTLLGKVQNFQRDMGALDEWHKAVTRGTKIGRVSEITKGGTVSPSLYTGPGGRVSSFLNIGRALRADKYVGEREKGSLTRTLLDVGAEKAAGKAREKKEK